MKDFTVTYELTDAQVHALEELTALLNEKTKASRTETDIFKAIMLTGSKGLIDERLNATAEMIEFSGIIAEQERIARQEKQAEGIKEAQAAGKHIGRPGLDFPENWTQVYTEWKAGEITAKEAMERTGTKRTSFYKLVKMTEDK